MKELLILKESKGLNNPLLVFDYIKKININFEQENVIIIYFDSKNEVIDSEVLFKGGLNSCVVDPKTLFRQALKRNACSLIMSHNHPSGDLNPSSEDIQIFNNLKKCGDILSLKVLDSIVFNETEYYSLLNNE